jgi:biopolymer transport protein ExbD
MTSKPGLRLRRVPRLQERHRNIIQPRTTMARHNHYAAVETSDPSLDISSLIDVTFLLLIYFLVTSAIQIRETDIGIKLPPPCFTPTQPHIIPMFIKIAADDSIRVASGPAEQVLDTNPAARELPMLTAHLDLYASAARSANDSPLVQLWADNGASQQRVVDVLNVLAAGGIRSVTFTDLVNP